MILSTAWTTPAVVLGAKTETRRDWSERQIRLAQSVIEAGKWVDLWGCHLDGYYETMRVRTIVEEWRPAKTAIRYICNLCAKTDEIGRKYCDRWPCFGITTKACSLCGRTPKYDHILAHGLRGVIATESSFWKHATREEALEALDSADFASRMAAANSEYFLIDAKVIEGRKFNATFARTSDYWNNRLHVVLPHPPTAMDWESHWTLPQIKKVAISVRDHAGLVSYKREDT